MHDIVVVGGGPAGLTAAIYGLRNGKSVLVIEKNVFGGQIVNSPNVENIPGFASVSGDEFGDAMLEQAMGQGAEVTLEEVTGVEVHPAGKGGGISETAQDLADEEAPYDEPGNTYFTVSTAEGSSYEGRTVILATGTTHRLLGLPGEEDLIGEGISFCAVCDGDFYANKTVVMIGGGNSAFVEANLLTGIVDKLIMLQDLPFFTADKKAQDQLLANDNVETHLGTKILNYEVEDGKLIGVTYEEDGETKTAACDGVFLAVGLVPENDAFAGVAQLDKRGYFEAGEDCLTKTPGIFAAGDCRSKTLRQVATACSDGAQAAVEACHYLDGLS